MDIDKTIKSLIRKGYTVSYFEDTEAAARYLDSSIDNKSIGFGDSLTLSGMALSKRLSAHNKVFDPQSCSNTADFIDTAKKCLTTEIFITSSNALSENGEIINIDGTGNRLSGSIFGHEKVYYVIGINKIVSTLEEAIWRAKNIAAPKNAKRLRLNTPCAVEGERCYDCSSPERICNAMLINFRKINDMDVEIVIINEKLGL